MRSRYTAYTQARIDYIQATMVGKAAEGFDQHSAAQWAKNVNWLDLNVIQVSPTKETTGEVEYLARYIDHDCLMQIHEKSRFHQQKGKWVYTGGELIHHPSQKLSPYDACPCGGIKKYKFCHAKRNRS